ncbi:MAG: ferredoxin family protein [Firmicutes bacterium]|jgi:formate hydrogenlyase subunit 6/NADH:ubiquinone oxidoreductase subunit I|uniref:4Fe-4S ferredoxin n=1 Tax=Sulfobacillus benefaciens TaxID=453960 RepID=A0A2T2XA08_9FIRM|nr:ferredoxin family protein [Bacillota bacterium]MCL5015362.1 ferredoxin family protein [Bacillota bacterium]PSR31319.1 MAG: 4Fe-4S ferredoxin [Sulfobacillus benefaciens]HBQ94817.1 4Fe-4S ferredoxin [Sulfobacillus sp.]
MTSVTKRTSPNVIVDRDKCIGCDICVQVCPMGILAMDKEKKAYMKYNECWYCLPCEVDCPVDAITVEIPYLVR